MSTDLGALQERWEQAWPGALDLWSSFTRLSPPRWCTTLAHEQEQRLSGSFAMIRLNDMAVVISLRQVAEYGLDDYATEVLAHEIGHHVYAPGNLTDEARVMARIRRALPKLEGKAGLVCNLYEDLLINDRLHRVHGLRLAEVYQALDRHHAAEEAKARGGWLGDKLSKARAAAGNAVASALGKGTAPQGEGSTSPNQAASSPDAQATSSAQGAPGKPGLFDLVMRIYEILWSLRRGTLTPAQHIGDFEGDAQLGARLVRAYARDWVLGGGRFATLCFPYLLDDLDAKAVKIMALLGDTGDHHDSGQLPDGLTAVEPDELLGSLHPSLDPRLNGDLAAQDASPDDSAASSARGRPDESPPAARQGGGQFREPFEYGQLLRSLKLELSDHDIAAAYYKERAQPHLVRFPQIVTPETEEPLAEGLEAWDIGSPLENADWLESVLVSPFVIPGVTTVQRTWGTTQGAEPKREPVDLDIYVDCSGSMPNPQAQVSYLTLAGAIIALSALRVGSRVQATLWSGTNQFTTTGGFVSDEKAILRILTGYFGGGTAFPLHVLRDTYASRPPGARKAHVLLISDDGADTMFDRDEKGTSGREVVTQALEAAGGGATAVLQLWSELDTYPFIKKMTKAGWTSYRITQWEELEAFAAAFSRRHYERPAPSRPRRARHA